MTWHVSDSGEKASVKARVVDKVQGFHGETAVAQALGALIEAQDGPHVSISGSGSNQSVSLSLSSFAAPA